MAPARFGTDGVRGVANEELTAELALALGRATARVLPAPTFVVGRDTRRSGPLLQAAFSAGLAAEGADVVDLGVLPTPGVAAVAERRKVPGAVISASHNPFGDNGIKLFSLLGTKLPTDVEGEIERELDAVARRPRRARPAARPATGWGGITTDPGAVELYRDAPPRHDRGPPPRRPARRASTAPTAPPARSRRGCSPSSARRSPRCTTRPTAPTSTTSAGRPTRAELSPGGGGAPGRPRPGLRRRRRPGHRGRPHRRHRRRRRPARAVRARPGRARPPGRQHGRRHRHDQPRASAWPWRAAASRCARPTWGTATCWPRSTPTG